MLFTHTLAYPPPPHHTRNNVLHFSSRGCKDLIGEEGWEVLHQPLSSRFSSTLKPQYRTPWYKLDANHLFYMGIRWHFWRAHKGYKFDFAQCLIRKKSYFRWTINSTCVKGVKMKCHVILPYQILPHSAYTQSNLLPINYSSFNPKLIRPVYKIFFRKLQPLFKE